MSLHVDVEYCGTCGYGAKFIELKKALEKHPEINITGHEGRRASFEVKVNDVLIHSKLSTMAFPDFEDVSNIVSEIKEGNQVRVSKQQPITNCSLM